MDLTSFAGRLQKAMQHAAMDAKELRRYLKRPDGSFGISGSIMSRHLSGDTNGMTAENCARAAMALKVDPVWLATGEGQMVRISSDGPRVAERAAPYALPLKVDAATAVRYMGQLLADATPERRESMVELVRAWVLNGGDPGRGEAIALLLEPNQTKQRANG